MLRQYISYSAFNLAIAIITYTSTLLEFIFLLKMKFLNLIFVIASVLAALVQLSAAVPILEILKIPNNIQTQVKLCFRKLCYQNVLTCCIPRQQPLKSRKSRNVKP